MNADIYVTGSNSKLLDTDYSTLLGGRTVRFDLYPLSFREFIHFRNYLTGHSLQYAVRDLRADRIQGILENTVCMELIRRGYTVHVGKFDTREVDFVAERSDGQKIYVQVCLEFSADEVYRKEFAPLKEIKDNFPKYVVSPDRYAGRNDGGVIGIHLRDFLLNGMSLDI